jgi:hypothetical protein
MIELIMYEVTPFLAVGGQLPHSNFNNGTNWLRDAINKLMNDKKDDLVKDGVDIDLFHNHNVAKGQNKNDYPKIQYQRKEKRFFVTGIDEGKFALEKLFADKQTVYCIDDNVTIKICQVYGRSHTVAISGERYAYMVNNWLPINHDNIHQYEKLEGLSEKIAFLENRLADNVVKDFCKYLKLDIDAGALQLKITFIDSFTREPVDIIENKYKKEKYPYNQPFTIGFTTNLQLPGNICLGNKKAFGFGLVETVNVYP